MPRPSAFLCLFLLALAACTTRSADEKPTVAAGMVEEEIDEAEGASLMARLSERVGNACVSEPVANAPTTGAAETHNTCYAMATRVAGYIWQYRQSVTIQAQVFRCVGQYAVVRGYRWGVRRFIGGAPSTDDTGMVAYLYQCAVPEWARNAVSLGNPASGPPVPRGSVPTSATVTASEGSTTGSPTEPEQVQSDGIM